MSLKNRLFKQSVHVDRETAEFLHAPPRERRFVRIHPPVNEDVPATLPNVVKGIQEFQTRWAKLRNTSPTVTYELVRAPPDRLMLQYSAPSHRLERKIRNHLHEAVPSIEFSTASGAVPVAENDSIGGGLLSVGRDDWLPLKTDHRNPPMNSVVTALHRHAMRDTKYVIQIMFKPVVGISPREWWWRHRAHRYRNFLRKEKEHLKGSVKATDRERAQARDVDTKSNEARFKTTIRILVIGAGEYTKSRMKEVGSGFNVFENGESGQYLDIKTLTPFWREELAGFADAVRRREFGKWHLSFHTTQHELAGLLSVPNTDQQNLRYR